MVTTETPRRTRPPSTAKAPEAPKADAEAAKPAFLTFSTLAPERPFVLIDEQAFELAEMDEFGITAQQALVRDGAEFQRLWETEDELEPEQSARLAMLLDRMFKQILVLPRNVALNDGQRARVVLNFLLEPQRAALAAAEQEIAAQMPGSSST